MINTTIRITIPSIIRPILIYFGLSQPNQPELVLQYVAKTVHIFLMIIAKSVVVTLTLIDNLKAYFGIGLVSK